MTFETEFKPYYSIDKDYQTNAPTYYDYLAGQNETFQSLLDDIDNAMNVDLVKQIMLATDATTLKLANLTKQEVTPKRWIYTLSFNRDEFKENKLDNTDGSITINRVNDTTTRISADVNKILSQLNVSSMTKTLKVYRSDYGTIKIELDKSDLITDVSSDDLNVTSTTDSTNGKRVKLAIKEDKWQKKLTAGENVNINNNVISVTGNANVSSKQDRITKLTNGGIFANEFVGVQPEGSYISTSPSFLTKEGVYFINGDNAWLSDGHWKGKIDTPTHERGFLFVHSLNGGENCYQEFVPWHGRQRYYRTGTNVFYSNPQSGYDTDSKYGTPSTYSLDNDEGVAVQSGTSDSAYWGDWRVMASWSINASYDSLTQNEKNMFQTDRIKNKHAGRVRSRNGIYLNNPYKGLIYANSYVLGKRVNFIPQWYGANVQNGNLGYAMKGDSQFCYTLENSGNGFSSIAVYDMQRTIGLKRQSLLTSNTRTNEAIVRSGADIHVTPKYVYYTSVSNGNLIRFIETEEKQINMHSVLNGKTEWNFTRPNGSLAKPFGVTGDPNNDNIIYFLIGDVKYTDTNNGIITENAGDIMVMYKLDFTLDINNPSVTKMWSKTRPSGYCAGMCYYNGYFYIDFNFTNGADDKLKIGSSYVYSETGSHVDTIIFEGAKAEESSGLNNPEDYNGADTLLTGPTIIKKPLSVNDTGGREAVVDGLPHDNIAWVCHGFYKKGDAQMIGRHRTYEDLNPSYQQIAFQQSFVNYYYKKVGDGVEATPANNYLARTYVIKANTEYIFNNFIPNNTRIVFNDGTYYDLGTSNDVSSYMRILPTAIKKDGILYISSYTNREMGVQQQVEAVASNNDFMVKDDVFTEVTGNTENITWPDPDDTTNDLDGDMMVDANEDEGILTLDN